MIKKINNVDINYEIYGEGKEVILLHGWGQNIEMMKPIGDRICDKNKVIIIDLPGHGKSGEPSYVWSIDDFVLMLKEFVDFLNIKKPILIGHSFGGKISLLYASRFEVSKLILFGSPYKKNIQKLSLKTKVLKSLKKVPVINKLEGFAKKHIGSEDYRNATPIMRDILVLTVNLDITEDVKKIKCPTFIVWGSLDEAVSVDDAYELEKLIPDAGLVVYEGCSHYAYLERINEVSRAIRSFIGSGE